MYSISTRQLISGASPSSAAADVKQWKYMSSGGLDPNWAPMRDLLSLMDCSPKCFFAE